MKSILKLQDGIYRQYSLYAYGKIQRLSPEEKAMLELYVKVNEGSSWIEIIPEPIIKCVAEKINSMTSNQILAAIAIVSVASVICVVTKKVLDHKQKMKELEVQAETLTGIQKSAAQAQIETIKATTEFYKEISKQSGTKDIEINGEKVDAESIKKIASVPRERKENSQEVIDGVFKVTDIHIHESSVSSDKDISIDVLKSDGSVYKDVNLLEGIIDKDDYQMLKSSTDKKEMNMKIVITKHGDEIVSAFLNSVEMK
ncbi:MAG: hypothetical protein UIT85_00535 [Treponema sp.]|nr:hypothetical protein [Treponema sp.]